MKLKFFYRIILCIAIFISGRKVYSQTSTVEELKGQYESYFKNSIQEKIFVHTDRTVYLTGEIIWFKLYVVESGSNRLLDLSKVAYVEVLDQANRPILRAKIELRHGTGKGSFYLPNDLATGNFRFRAYTNWMKNFSANGFFEKIISIINILRPPDILLSDTTRAYSLSFFPEGGNLVQGIESKIAFLATDKNGNGINFRGTITANSKDTILNFQATESGMGIFSLTPKEGVTYKSNILFSDGTQKSFDLPTVFERGWVMNLTQSGKNNVNISLKANSSLPGEEAFLIIHNASKVVFAAGGKFQNGSLDFSIQKDQLESGILTATVINSQRHPVCERLFFESPKEKLVVKASSDQLIYNPRQKIKISLSNSDNKGIATRPELSVSVYRMDSLQRVGDADIFSYLWLSSGISGGPGNAFNLDAAKPGESEDWIDEQLLTKGWRRIKWEDVSNINRASFEFLPEYEGHIITGKVTRAGGPEQDVVTYLSFPGISPRFFASKSDSSGTIKFFTQDIYGPGELIVQTASDKDSTIKVDISSPFSEKYSNTKLAVFQINPALEKLVMRNSVSSQVQNVYSANSLRKFREPLLDTVGFYGKPDVSYFLDDYTRFTTMEEVLREYVSPVNVGKPGGKFHLYVIDDPRRILFKDDPLVLLDGVPILDMDQIMSYDPLKIRKLEVVSRKYYYGPMVIPGIASFSTYKGNLEDFHLDPHAIILDYEGLQNEREFYSPGYETENKLKSRTPDFRNLLFWSPDVKVNSSGQSEIEFYSSDQKGKYILVVQGITEDGKAGSTTISFEVK